jgi:hypothetical protein
MRPPQIAFPALLQSFFQQRLVTQRGASAQTIASYRDTFELFLRYVEQAIGRSPSALCCFPLKIDPFIPRKMTRPVGQHFIAIAPFCRSCSAPSAASSGSSYLE